MEIYESGRVFQAFVRQIQY